MPQPKQPMLLLQPCYSCPACCRYSQRFLSYFNLKKRSELETRGISITDHNYVGHEMLLSQLMKKADHP